MASAYVIDSTKITTFANLTANDMTPLNTTISEIVKEHDLLANSIDTFAGFSTKEFILAIRAGVLA